MASAAAVAAKEALDVNSPSKVFKEIGSSIPEGTALGITDNTAYVKNAAVEMANNAVNTFKEVLDINSPSGFFEELGKYVPQGAALGINENAFEVENASENMAKTALSAFKEYLEEEKFYGRITVEEELAGWQKMQSMYVEGSEERKEIDREIYTLKNELFEKEIDGIETLTKEKKQSQYDELASYKRLQSKYKKGTAQRIALDEKILETQEEINDVNETYYKDVEKLHEETAEKKYVFQVAINANKTEIKAAVEEIFGVKVAKVNTVRMQGKVKRTGAYPAGRRAAYKKAIVTLTADSKTIEFFEGMV